MRTSSPIAVLLFAAKHGDVFIMDDIANRVYENGKLTMMKAEYRGKVVQVYTRRKKS